MKQSTIRYNRLKGFYKVYWFVRRKGKQYAKDNFYTPDKVLEDFHMWIELTGRERVYLEKNKAESFISDCMRHFLITEERYITFKKNHKKTDKFVAKKLGYTYKSFTATAFKWNKVEMFLDIFEENLAIA